MLMMLGSTGYGVEALQEMLQGLGYEINVTGTFDETTKKAVCAFQQKEGIDCTGVANDKTQMILAMRAAAVH